MCCVPVSAGLGIGELFLPVLIVFGLVYVVWHILTTYFVALVFAELLAVIILGYVIVRHVRRDSLDGFDVAGHNDRARQIAQADARAELELEARRAVAVARRVAEIQGSATGGDPSYRERNKRQVTCPTAHTRAVPSCPSDDKGQDRYHV